jgi:hypothetical protein
MNNDNTQPSPVSAETSLVSRLTNVFIAPGEVFAEVQASPVRHANWLVAALVFVLLSWCGSAVMFSQESVRHQLQETQEQAMRKQFQKQIDAGQMTQAQVDQIVAQTGRFTQVGVIVGGTIGPLFGGAIAPFLGGFMLWALGRWVFKRPFDFLKGVEASGLTLVVTGLGMLVKGLLCAAMGSMFVSPGLILLVKEYDATNLAHTLLLTFDAFAIWGTVLSAVALAKLAQAGLVKALVCVAIVTFTLTGGMLTMSWAVQRAFSG